ncbi:hypothetical protein MKW98_017001 [Papaver atlanticum]|uniref:Uncharacterized protein n=1 Tax=Papaver atlanticum TaxID=357466 RepID=A0AAD4XZC8_9MAGN|nr:hypothetical protein MKW98_017001 [Papaver atlanticum]
MILPTSRIAGFVIQLGVVPRFVQFLQREDFPQLQFDVALALMNIAFGTSEITKVVIQQGAIPIFVALLILAVWALGNVAGDSPKCRDLVLGHGALIPLLNQSNEHAKLSMLRNSTWTLSNFCRGKPQPSFEQTKPALHALKPVIEVGACHRLVELLFRPSPTVLIPALCTVGNIVTGDDRQTQLIFDVYPASLQSATNSFSTDIIRLDPESCHLFLGGEATSYFREIIFLETHPNS